MNEQERDEITDIYTGSCKHNAITFYHLIRSIQRPSSHSMARADRNSYSGNNTEDSEKECPTLKSLRSFHSNPPPLSLVPAAICLGELSETFINHIYVGKPFPIAGYLS